MFKAWNLYLIFISYHIIIENGSAIPRFSSKRSSSFKTKNKSLLNDKNLLGSLLKNSNISNAVILNRKLQNQTDFKPEIQSNPVNSNDKKELLTSSCQVDSEEQVKELMQKTYRKIADDFKKLEELTKMQEKIERKIKEDEIKTVDGVNNIITIENVCSSLGNYTKVILSKRKVCEVKHSMPLLLTKSCSKLQ